MTDQVVAWRRHLHRHPEPSYEEFETAQFVAETLEGFGDALEVQRPSETSVVARLRTGRPGRTLAIRADTDALPVQERSDVEFASQRDGVMHACGHDGHTAMLLGAAQELLARANELSGEVRFLFQPAEERPPGGARALIAAGRSRASTWSPAATSGPRCRSARSRRRPAPRWRRPTSSRWR